MAEGFNKSEAKVIATLEKLLALANDKGATPEEAEVALRKAQELMEKHNIDEASLNKDPSARDDKNKPGGLYVWQRKVWDSVAKVNYCRYQYMTGNKRGQKYSHRLIGKPVNVLSTEMMATYLQDTIERIAREEAKRRGINIFKKEMMIYREGMADSVILKLWNAYQEKISKARQEEARAKAEAQTNPSGCDTTNAVTIVTVHQTEEDLNTDYLWGLEPGTTAQRRAEREARQAVWEQEDLKKEAEHERRLAEDPEYAKQWEEKQREELEERLKAEKKEAQNARRRKKPAPRWTKEDERRASPDYISGRHRGDKISIDEQVTGQTKKGLR